MRMYDIITKKRDGGALTRQEIAFFLHGYVAEEIPDYQAAALLMAMYLQGINEAETLILTEEMARSGDMMDLSRFGSRTVDKHSTGGVGDKTTLICTPIAAACGAVVAKMSGRGLGHTGGTVDKLESLPGLNTRFTQAQFLRIVEQTGLAVIGQSGNLAPADKKLYALRDVTGTVEHRALIASSIMSKKLAAGSQNIVLDVKTGSGAFMNSYEESRALAQAMVDIGSNAGRNTRALITNMDLPLGYAVGNALEVKEAAAVLRGAGPEDLKQVSLELAAHMIALALHLDNQTARAKAEAALAGGQALEKLKEMTAAQGGDPNCIDDPSLLPQASRTREVRAARDGYVTAMDAGQIGVASLLLGAGRETKEDGIDYGAGIILQKKVGDAVNAGDCIAVLHTNRETALDPAEETLANAYRFGTKAPQKQPLIYEVIQ